MLEGCRTPQLRGKVTPARDEVKMEVLETLCFREESHVDFLTLQRFGHGSRQQPLKLAQRRNLRR